MAFPLDQRHRVARLQELLDHEDFGGGKASFGRALGFKDGAYVRQMLAGERAISEKLMHKIETIRGGKYRGWFASSSDSGRDEAEMIAAFRALQASPLLRAKAIAFAQGLAAVELGEIITHQAPPDEAPPKAA
jgi:hypothetical protein